MTTLVFLMGFVNNFSNYLLSKFSSHEVWDKYFFQLELVSKACAVVYSFGFVTPILLYFIVRCLKDA